jgi:hypothetical protein
MNFAEMTAAHCLPAASVVVLLSGHKGNAGEQR